ncbi:hypothetical protein NIES2100_75900 [Calothrix sp. NIES-2100]|uniref:NACHT C-terminal alpha/beta 1 domain-containing protein n=1 Tax=Calothrix sp. NIES-2100 TaxID=1954172 RepID=UPI000B5E7464|nr:hypothetical protein NIES2100_75900 [Calothrix sp. NIES-2100]
MPEKPKRKFGTGETHQRNVLSLVKALLMLSNQELTPEEPAASAVKVQWVTDNQLQVTGENKIKNKIVAGTTKHALWELAEKTDNSLQLPQRQHENAGVNTEQRKAEVVQNVFEYLEYLEMWKDERPENKKNTRYWIFTLTLKHKDASIPENITVVQEKLQLETVPQIIDTSTNINWREVCTAMLKSQQEAARLRRKATEQGFEINIYVPLGLVERKQQQRRHLDEQRDRENVYELTQEVIVKTYEHDAFLREVIAQQPPGNNKHIAIIGEPGAGKTTLLSTIASFIKDKTQDLPIFISLANLQGRTIEEYLRQQWLPEAMRAGELTVVPTPEIERQLIECFGKGGVWLLLDGVDEMGENSPVQALAKITQELTASLRQGRVVLTCRLNVWDAKVSNPLTGFDTYKTQEFKPEHIDDFIQQWFKNYKNSQKGEILQVKLKETKHENIRKLVTNPLRLSLLCQTFDLDRQGELPETKAALYQRFTHYFYEWKSELFAELYQSDDLKNELHDALSRLAFAGINSSARFRLQRKLAHQEMGERLLKLACDVGWLNLVDRIAIDDEEVYAFFHPNFQEYFAALAITDWQVFLDHNNKIELPNYKSFGTIFNPRNYDYFAGQEIGIWTNWPNYNQKLYNYCLENHEQNCVYRIFEPQWQEVILLWLGREVNKDFTQSKEEFIKLLVEFNDNCMGFYSFRAYFLAAMGIVEFKNCTQSDNIVAQLFEWSLGHSDENPLSKAAMATLSEFDYVRLSKYIDDIEKSCEDDIDDYPTFMKREAINCIYLTLFGDNCNEHWKNKSDLNPINYSIEYENIELNAIKSLGESNDAIDKLLNRLYSSQNRSIILRSALSLINILADSLLMKKVIIGLRDCLSIDQFVAIPSHGEPFVAYENQFYRFKCSYLVLWHCAQNMHYTDFYNAWHQGKYEDEKIECQETFNQIDFIQSFQAAINNDSQLSHNIHLICIDTSKFIDPDNPASKIYTTIVKAGCPKCEDGTPKTMAELQTYWELLETDKRVVLVFYPSATNTTDEVKYSDRFLSDISKFEGAICFMSNPIPNHNTLKFFPPSQPIDEIVEWLRRS